MPRPALVTCPALGPGSGMARSPPLAVTWLYLWIKIEYKLSRFCYLCGRPFQTEVKVMSILSLSPHLLKFYFIWSGWLNG